ncbi:MAG: hypothetical protein EBU08_00310 [Micrococcales bacterium]|nr:hypothetical protein [Micrococcales bacterium]
MNTLINQLWFKTGIKKKGPKEFHLITKILNIRINKHIWYEKLSSVGVHPINIGTDDHLGEKRLSKNRLWFLETE